MWAAWLEFESDAHNLTVVAAFTLCKSRTGGREGTWSHLRYCQRLTKKSLHIIFPISQPFNLSCHLTVHSLSILTLKRFCFNWTQTWVYPKVILLITFSSWAFIPSSLQFCLHSSWIGRNYEGIHTLTFNLECVHYGHLSSFCFPVFSCLSEAAFI